MSKDVEVLVDGVKVRLLDITPSQDMADKIFPPQIIGPTWATDEDGDWLLPEITLGWEVIGWIATNLTNEDGGAWIPTGEQARFILWYYALDRRGRFSYRKAVLQRLKGWGKDPVAAVLCMIELVGPSRFKHWAVKRNGSMVKIPKYIDGAVPVGKPHPAAYIQVTAVSLDQTENTMMIFPSLIPERTKIKYDIEMNKEIIRAHGGKQKLKALAASYRAAEGGRVSFAILNETHHWIPSKGGDKFYRTLTRNITKVGGRFICITNAYEPGEESVAQSIREGEEKVWAGLEKGSGWLYDSIEAHADAPLTDDWAPYIVTTIRGDAVWLDVELIVLSLQDGTVGSAEHRRMWYNAIVASEDALYGPKEWDAIRKEGALGTKDDLNPGDIVTMGFDGGKTDDATALVVIRIEDKLIVPWAIWQKPDGDQGKAWRISETEVDSAVHEAFSYLNVHAFFADVALWESYISTWNDVYREQLLIKATSESTIGFDMRGHGAEIARGNEGLMATIENKRIFHNGDKILRIHTLNAKRRRNRFGVIFAKEHAESSRKVDAYAALLLAYIAMIKLAESGKKPAAEYDRTFYQW